MLGVERERQCLRERPEFLGHLLQRAVAHIDEAAQRAGTGMGIEISRQADRLAADPVHALDRKRAVGRSAARLIIDTAVGIVDQREAVLRADKYAPVRLVHRPDADQLRKLLHHLVALIDKAARFVAANDGALDIGIERVNLLDETVCGIRCETDLLIGARAKKSDRIGEIGNRLRH